MRVDPSGRSESCDPGRPAPEGKGSRLEVEGYEPPRLERVLAPADLEREILYAGEDDLTADT
jgi:hypothetical protein